MPVQGRAKAGGLSAAQAKLSDFLISPKSVPMLAFRNMRPSEAFHEHRAAIRQIVERHRACNVRVFGSVLHGDDVEGGDLDLLVDPLPQATLMDIAAIQLDLEIGLRGEHAAHSDRIEDTIDYAEVVADIRKLFAEQHFALLEHAAESIAQLVIRDFKAPWLRITIAKLAPLAGVKKLGVTIERGKKKQRAQPRG